MISIKHGSRTATDAIKSDSRSLTWQGTREELLTFAATLVRGQWYEGLGRLTTTTLSQEAGALWNLRLDYEVTRNDSGEVDKGEVSAPSTQTLSARIMSKPIETHPAYKTRWNFYLIGKGSYSGEVPAWWLTATDTYLDPGSDGKNYRWVKSLSETPLPSEDGAVWSVVKGDATVCRPTKPGVDSYDYAYYVITETGKHKTKQAAGWVTARLINSVVTQPLLGDFGLTGTGYNWKVDDISVAYDGKLWAATRTYTRSGDSAGWDADLYGAAVEP